MAYDKKGKAPKVKGRWYGDHKYRRGRDFSPREFKVDSQFKLDGLYITLFLTREEIDKLWWNLLSDVLSDKQKKAKVGNMLTKMREERIIVNETKGNVSVWSLLKTKK